MNPPGPPGRPFVGNLLEFGGDPLGFFSDCAAGYGDVVSLNIAGWPALFLNHPDHFENVLLTNNRNFIKHTFFWRHVPEIFGRGLLTNEGTPWLRQRRLMQPSFHKDRVSSYAETMRAYTRRMLDRWRPGRRDVHADLMKLTMEIATKTLFGSDLPEQDAAEVSAVFNDAIGEIANRFRRPFRIPRWVPLPSNIRYTRAVARLDRLIYGIIDEKRRGDGSGDDLLTMLLEVRDEDGSRMDTKQVRDEAITIFLAGHETTAIALSWTFYLLAQHPQADTSDLANVIHESMRLYPPAYAFGREAVADCQIGGYGVPAKTTIFMAPWVSHRDARWFDDPLSFCPERWKNDFAKTLPRFAYLPFGGGPRICIGNNFAMMEMQVVLEEVMQRYRMELPPGQIVDPFPSITLRPRQGMPLDVVSR